MTNFTAKDVALLMTYLKVGKVNAMTSDQLAQLLNLAPQRTNELLRELISYAIAQGELIGRSSSGYWIIDSVAELDEVLNSLEGRAQGTCDRRNRILATWNATHPHNQSTLPPKNVM